MLPCHSDSSDNSDDKAITNDNDKVITNHDNDVAIHETVVAKDDPVTENDKSLTIDITICDNNVENEDEDGAPVDDKENVSPDEAEETEAKPGKKKNKKRRKHAKKKPKDAPAAGIEPAEAVPVEVT